MYFRLIILISILTVTAATSHGQKTCIDSSVFKNWYWPYAEKPLVSNNGKFALSTIYNVPLENSTVIVKSLVDGWEKSFISTASPECAFTTDSHYLIILNRSDSLNIFDLFSNSSKFISNVKSYEIFDDGDEHWVAYQLQDSSQNLILWNLETQTQHEFNNVRNFEFDKPAHSLLLQTKINNDKDTGNTNILELVNLKTFDLKKFWIGKSASNFIFDSSGNQLAFMSEEYYEHSTRNFLRYYKFETAESIILYRNELDDSLTVDNVLKFNNAGNKIIINLIKATQPFKKTDSAKVDVWSYKDRKLQSVQLNESNESRTYQAVLDLHSHAIIRLEFEDEYIQDNSNLGYDSLVMIIKRKNDSKEWNWNKEAYDLYYLVSTIDGSRKLVYKNKYPSGNPSFNLSPNGKFAIFYNAKEKNYFAYSISNGNIINITKRISATWDLWAQDGRPKFSQGAFNIAGWISDDSKVILCDRYDLFEVDPLGKLPPINITNGYGRKHNILFRMAFYQSTLLLGRNDKIILNAFDLNNKNNGFFSARLGKNANPVLLTLQPSIFIGFDESDFVNMEAPIKALDTNVYIVRRMTATTSPNYYSTSDFKTFTPISNVHPELQYNWLTTQLITWKKLDGISAQGILYKPENFDPQKKYPLIIYYYEKLSDGLNAYLKPDYCQGPMNIPYFVSNGYLVFTPDINFKVGYPGYSVVNSVVSATQYLSKLPFVNKSRIGIQGHSRGGYETNYLVTHSHFFAAASSACGMSDYINLSFSLTEDGRSRSPGFELLSQRIGATLWQRPDLYIANSPIFKVDKITTPLLILADKNDPDVPFSQGLEFYLALRRLGKKAWMLQYDDQGHVLSSEYSKKDYTIRLMQFFNYYLKSTPPPKWMTEGIPARLKGIETGLELDSTYRERGLGSVVENEPVSRFLLKHKTSTKKKANAKSASAFIKPK